MPSSFRVIALVLVLATAVLAPAFAPTARAAMDLPVWRNGDFWLYDISGDVAPQPGAAGTMRLEVRGTESVVVAGISYPSYRLNLTFSITYGSFTLTIPGDAWFRTSDLAPVKMTFTMTISVPPNPPVSFSVSVTYNPPPELKWPLGSTSLWSASSTVRTITEITGQPPIDVNATLSASYQVDPEEENTVPAGRFTVTPITQTDTATGDYTRSYWSRDAGNTVNETSYDTGDVESGSTRLRSYRYTPPAGGGGGSVLGLPAIGWGLILILVVVAVVAAVLIRRRRPSAPAPYPGATPMGTYPQAPPAMPSQPPGPPGGPQPPPP